MKLSCLIVLSILPSMVALAQNKFVVKSLQNSEALKQYSTIDESGNALELLSALVVSLNQKECDPKGIPLLLKSNEKKEYHRPALYCWNSMLKCWKKSAAVQKINDKGKVTYQATINCPGTYAFLDATGSLEKRVLVSLPSKSKIKKARIVQQSPAYSVAWEGKATNEIELPFGPLQFDAVLEITWEEAGVNKSANYLCGALTRIEEIPQAGEIRKLEVKPGKTVEYQSTLFTNKSN
jgi:hypothetical protein